MAELTEYQKDILVRTILGEARGEGVEGMAAVANNIRNRSNSGKFSSDPAKVALQPSQYSVWNSGAGGGKTNFSKGSELYKKAERIVDGVWGGTIADNTNGALYYHNPSVSPGWASAVNQHGTTRIGNHIFYNGRPTPPGEIPNVVGTLTDTVPPRRAAPVTASPNMAAYRASAKAPTSLVSDTMGMLSKRPQNASQPRAADLAAMDAKPTAFLKRDGLGVQDMAQLAMFGSKPDYLSIGSLPSKPQSTRSAPPMPKNVQASYAGQERSTVAGKRSAPPMPTRAAQSYAGQDRSTGTASRSAPVPAQQSTNMAIRRAPGTTVASIPTRTQARLPDLPPSRLGQPPATRTVASVPVRAATSASDRVRGNPVQTRNQVTTVATIPTVAPRQQVSASDMVRGRSRPQQMSVEQMYAGIYPSEPGDFRVGGNRPNQPTAAPRVGLAPGQVAAIGVGPEGPQQPLRVASGAPAPLPRNARPNIQVARSAPVPFQRPTAVGTQLAVTPPRTAPMPFMRPNFPMGIGGPDLVGLPQNGAPMPRPRLPAFAPQGANVTQVPRQAPQLMGPSVVQQLRAAGLSAAAAYDRANSGNSPRSAADNFGQGTSNSNNSTSAGAYSADDAAGQLATLEWLRKRGR